MFNIDFENEYIKMKTKLIMDTVHLENMRIIHYYYYST